MALSASTIQQILSIASDTCGGPDWTTHLQAPFPNSTLAAVQAVLAPITGILRPVQQVALVQFVGQLRSWAGGTSDTNKLTQLASVVATVLANEASATSATTNSANGNLATTLAGIS